MTLKDTARELVEQSRRDELLTVKEYADLFRVRPNAVYTAIRRGRLPYAIERPTGGEYRIRVPMEKVAALRAA